MSLRPGTLLQGGKYQIVSQLGHGGFGVTYVANHNLLDKKVCIKEFFPKDFMNRDEDQLTMCVNSASNVGLMDALKRRFIKEARIISRFEHPNIISIYDVFEENATAYYVMEYIDGYSLYDMIKLNGAFDVEPAVKCINKVLDAVEYIHNNNTLHLDIKPSNIMVRRSDGRVTLIDFGLSKEIDDQGQLLTSTSVIGVSPRFAPLEQMQRSAEVPMSTATDIYATGATLLMLVTGNLPPMISDVLENKHIEMVSSQPENIKDAIAKSMEVTPLKRIKTVAEFRALLNAKKEVTGGGTGNGGGNGDGGNGNGGNGNGGGKNNNPPAEKPKVKMWMWIAAMVAVIAISGGAYWYTKSFNSAIEEEIELLNRELPRESVDTTVDEVFIKRNARSVVTIKSTVSDVYYDDMSHFEFSELKRTIRDYDSSTEGVRFVYNLCAECGSNLLEVVFEEGWSIEYDYYDEDGEYMFTTEISQTAYEEWYEGRGDRYEEDVYDDGPNMII